jgi:hypothetical protein
VLIIALELTPKALSEAKFKGPTKFYDYADGGARQDFECVDEPRFGYAWQRASRADNGRQFYMVDGCEVADLDEAVRLLYLPIDPERPNAVSRGEFDEFRKSPSLNYGGSRAWNEAECNWDAGPFGMVRASVRRAENAWRVGINAFAAAEREVGRDWPRWLYEVKNAAHESYRLMDLFRSDRKTDTDLRCTLGKRCRDCPVLRAIDTAMVEQQRMKWQSGVEDFDIDAAKTWTSVGHILRENAQVTPGGFLSTKAQRDDIFPEFR